MMTTMRRNRLAIASALLSALFVLAVVCPCPWPAASADSTTSEHDCCVPGAGIRALAADCCADHGVATPRTATIVAPAAHGVALIPVEFVAQPAGQPVVVFFSLPVATASSPPLPLRI